jgi:Tfp pilus assembly protein FimT
MARKLDLARLREQTMGSNADEEAVTVNTRALIDKVLARYSGDWTTLRELIQNAADAQASKVVIRFESLPSKTVPVPTTPQDSDLLKHTLQHHTVYRLTVSNNGQAFNDNDWNRLKRIAEGNPDETKIGAFGVGFYSVFADCEEPFVISGNKTMAFLWKGNSLFTKASILPQEQGSQETTFLLNFRNTTSPIPDLTSICQFLSTSLTFVGLESIDLWLDQWKILSLQKTQAPGSDAQLPADINTRTKERLMKVVGVVHQNTQINAQWMNAVGWKLPSSAIPVTVESYDSGPSLRSLFSRLTTSTHSAAARKAAREAEAAAQQQIADGISGISNASVFLRISTVNVQTYVTSTFAQELERATKKPPPKHTRIAILTSSHDEVAASLSSLSGLTADKAKDLFTSVTPTKHGRVFIGFPTAQTTGLLCHISAPSVIPTVERESIDLNARYVRTWNIEMLRVAGIACRIAYSGELADLKRKIDSAVRTAGRPSASQVEVDTVMDQAVHVSKQYTAVESTPSSQVGNIIEEAFWECSEKGYIEILSTKGVLPSNRVRVVSEPLSFLAEIPVIPSALAKRAEDFVRKLYDHGLVSDMTIKDIKSELEARSLEEEQLVEFFKWASAQLKTSNLDQATIRNLLDSTVATLKDPDSGASKSGIGSSTGGKILVLANVNTYVSGSKMPPDMPMPPSTLPFKFSRVIPADHLSALGFEELQVVPWMRFLVEGESTRALPTEHCLSKNPDFAAQVLGVLSKRWYHLSQNSRGVLVELLSARTCIPTKLGMRRPSDAYFASVKLFDDLPTVTGLMAVKDNVLAALGVRKTIELNYVFDRLMNPTQKDGQSTWSFFDLVQYLASVRDDIPMKDIERLRATAICPLEGDDKQKGRPGSLRKVSDVFEPKEVLRKMGLPILQWNGFYRFASPEAKFLTFLGIKQHPSVMELVKVMVQAAAQKDRSKYDLAINYFREHYHTNGYAKFDLSQIKTIPFLPTAARGFPSLVSPGECFANERVAIMGYSVLSPELKPHAMQFGVLENPSISECVQRLRNDPPKSHRRAMEVFGYFAGRLPEINGQLAENLSNMLIVPIIGKGEKPSIRLASPKTCFLGDPSTYGDIFDFVDFGLDANSFLLKVGSKHEPSTLELGRMVASNPSKVLGMIEEERYLELLRKLAENQTSIRNDMALWADLKRSPCLLAYKEVPAEPVKGSPNTRKSIIDEDFDDEDAVVRVYSLRKASDIVIVDDIRVLIMFRDVVAQAPQDDSLEIFYGDLGTPMLSALVELANRVGNVQRDQSDGEQLRKLVVQRSRLFLHEYSNGVRHDSKWLEKHLSVRVVDSVSLTYSLKGYGVPPVREKRTASMTHAKNKDLMLYITRKHDLYEVSTWICRILLSRPKQHDYLALEMVLGSDLRRLKTKGYNVDRILRQREHETRLAEEQKRRQEDDQRQAEVKRLAEQEDKSLPPPPYDASTALTPAKPKSQTQRTPQHPKMPGAFNFDSPEADHSSPPEMPNGAKASGGPNSLFTSAQGWAKQLGDQFRGNTPGPGQAPNPAGGLPAPNGHPPRHHTANVKSSEKNVAHNLTNAIQSCRSHASNSLFSPPQTTNVEESKGSYCDSQQAQDISFAMDSAAGIKVFLANHMASAEKSSFLSANMGTINTFGYILLDVSSIFDIAPQALHIFYDTQGATIAFNSGGALFFNYHWFEQLHMPHFMTSRDKQIDAVAYWWIVFCHELAHNLVKEHSAQHSYYAESFAQQYFGKVMQKALQY